MDEVELVDPREDLVHGEVEPRQGVAGVARGPQRFRDRGMSRPGRSESPVAKVVTSWPRRSSSTTSPWTIRSVPP